MNPAAPSLISLPHTYIEIHHPKRLSTKKSPTSIINMDTAQTSKSSGRFMPQMREPAIKVTLPTGEAVSSYQQSRRSHISGFPAITEPLPAGILTEDIIKQWPNHLVRTSWAPIFSWKWALCHVLGELVLIAMFRDSEIFLEIPLLTPRLCPVGTASTADSSSLESKTNQQSKRRKT